MTPKQKVDLKVISWEDNFFVQKNYLCGNICYNWKNSIFKFQKMSDDMQQHYIKDFWIRIYLICKTQFKIWKIK